MNHTSNKWMNRKREEKGKWEKYHGLEVKQNGIQQCIISTIFRSTTVTIALCHNAIRFIVSAQWKNDRKLINLLTECGWYDINFSIFFFFLLFSFFFFFCSFPRTLSQVENKQWGWTVIGRRTQWRFLTPQTLHGFQSIWLSCSNDSRDILSSSTPSSSTVSPLFHHSRLPEFNRRMIKQHFSRN